MSASSNSYGKLSRVAIQSWRHATSACELKQDFSMALQTALPEPLRLDVSRQGPVPTLLWEPACTPRAIVLACHGGSGHKAADSIVEIARRLLPLGVAVLSTDGPVHGERRADGDLTAATARAAFREAWRAGVGREDMASDMSAALRAALGRDRYTGLPAGYIGVSMGTAYGLPLLATERRIRAAAIGLWSTTYPASQHLEAFARRAECPVWFTQQWDDEFFDRAATADLFDAIGSKDKRLVAYPGPHRELEGERLDDAVAFIERKLGLRDS
jgi:dienelactone hydrolase